jgi:hypothetical protein
LRGGSTDHLDEYKRRLAAAVVSQFSAHSIRAHGLANLHRWKAAGVWNSAYERWQEVLEHSDDGELFALMLGRDERSNQLRQSPPYVGMLPRDVVESLNEKASVLGSPEKTSLSADVRKRIRSQIAKDLASGARRKPGLYRAD